ncbi:MAG: TRASH domain-containing protein [Sphingobacteriales bacterium]|nr:TRASH domain-containing protein [Sphingobacteriales bacterium]MBI3718601.1 TRASH domain-containing protein [Sphingobacteriales bacterium]
MKNYSSTIFALFMVALFSCNNSSNNIASKKSIVATSAIIFSDTAITKLLNKQVCMINNRFMNSDQIAVPIENKTYYGCCEGCVKALNEDSTTHYTTDPLSGEQVDKAIAFIIGKPGSKEDVLYFKTETNAREYFAKTFQPVKGSKSIQ